MSIPKMTNDLAIIQKLSDLPNSTDGLTAAQLKAKFDEGPQAIQKWINETLVPSITAAMIPFAASTEINADNIDAAIRAVHQQIRDAASGVLVNGSVTKEKMSEELLSRVYGGRPWVSLNNPGSERNPDTDFPIGQLWLRPAFTVSNAAGTDWEASGCTVAAGENVFTITGNNTVMTVTVTQTLQSVGNTGDRVYVLFGVDNKDSEITAMTVSLNGGAEQDVSAGVFMTTLTSGKLTVKISVTWPATSLAGGSVDITNFAIVNADGVLRQTDDAEDMADWPDYLAGLLPLGSYQSTRELYVQTVSGEWQKFDQEVFSVERGGTGLNAIGQGELLVGGVNNTLTPLPVSDDDALLQMVGGQPKWSGVEDVVNTLGILRMTSGTYTGTGSSNGVQRPLKPKGIFLRGPRGTNEGSSGGSTTRSVCATLVNGAYAFSKHNSANTIYEYYARLYDDYLAFDTSTAATDALFMNRAGDTYNWIALY